MPIEKGKHGPIFDWFDDAKTKCTETGSTYAFWSFQSNWGYGYNGANKLVFFDGSVAAVWCGQQSLIQDAGMGGIFGGVLLGVNRDSENSRYGNVGLKGIIRFLTAKNQSEMPAYVNYSPGTDTYADGGDGSPQYWNNFRWRNRATVYWGPASAYMYPFPEDLFGTITKLNDFHISNYNNGTWPLVKERAAMDLYLYPGRQISGYDFYPYGTATLLNDIKYHILSNAHWPRLYWNKKGYACPDNNDVNSKNEPYGHNDDGATGHTKVRARFYTTWRGSGPRMSKERSANSDFYITFYVPDVPPEQAGWLYSPGGSNGGGTASPWISAGTVTETTIYLSYGASMPPIGNMLGYADNDIGRYRVTGSRTNGWLDVRPSSSASSSWNVSGLTPDTVYSFRTQAQSNPDNYGGRAYAYSGWVSRRTMAKPSAPQNNQYSKWDTPRVNVICPYWGNDIAYPTDAANITQVVDYVFNQSSTDTSGYSTTGRVGGNVVIQAPWHSTGQNSGFWVHTRTRNAWGVSPWVHTWFETVDRLYRPGARRQSDWRSHQASGGKSHRFTGSWTEMTTRSEFRPDGVTEHPNDDPTARSGDKIHPEDPNKWRNQDLIGAEATWYPEVDFYP